MISIGWRGVDLSPRFIIKNDIVEFNIGLEVRRYRAIRLLYFCGRSATVLILTIVRERSLSGTNTIFRYILLRREIELEINNSFINPSVDRNRMIRIVRHDWIIMELKKKKSGTNVKIVIAGSNYDEIIAMNHLLFSTFELYIKKYCFLFYCRINRHSRWQDGRAKQLILFL